MITITVIDGDVTRALRRLRCLRDRSGVIRDEAPHRVHRKPSARKREKSIFGRRRAQSQKQRRVLREVVREER